MTETQQDSDRLRRFFRKFLIAFALLGFTMAGTVYYVWSTSQNNKDALCAYREDLEARIATGEQFLEDNPNGIPGVSPNLMKTNLANQKRAAEAFSVVNCDGLPLKAQEGEKDT